jgi:hypothetical protein
MKTIVLLLSLSFAQTTFAANFPLGPDMTETPGKLCSNGSVRRYPEGILYCERDVDTYTKNAVIMKYDNMFGYRIHTMKRADFKIDHFIPLCAGGANSEENLWPQHKSVYAITDPLEPLLCQKMSEGKLLQADAVKLVTRAKLNLKEVPEIIKSLNRL